MINPKLAPTINLAATPNPARAGSQVSLTVTLPVATGNPTHTGTVNFFDGSTQLGSAVISRDSSISLPVTLAAGAHSITATYAGDSNYLGGTSTAVCFRWSVPKLL